MGAVGDVILDHRADGVNCLVGEKWNHIFTSTLRCRR